MKKSKNDDAGLAVVRRALMERLSQVPPSELAGPYREETFEEAEDFRLDLAETLIRAMCTDPTRCRHRRCRRSRACYQLANTARLRRRIHAARAAAASKAP